ncbi:MAG: DUF3429 domain-containing protein [Pseudomonadota bacterium]
MSEGADGVSAAALKLAWGLALGGFIPFGGLAVAAFAKANLGLSLSAQEFFILWSLVILSFLGGIRWGMAVTAEPLDATNLALSVIPCILGWFSLLLSDFITVAALLVLYALHGWWDYTHLSAKPWFARIRLVLTALVVGAHILVLAGLS